MARTCVVTGKGTVRGNNVSHSNRKTKRRFCANLRWKRFWLETENRWVRIRVSSAGMRTIDKHGIESLVATLRAQGEKV
jgi:large subunit ribosomal protein L28